MKSPGHYRSPRFISAIAMAFAWILLLASAHPACAQGDSLDAYIAKEFFFSVRDTERIVYTYHRYDYRTQTTWGASSEITDEWIIGSFLTEMEHTTGTGVLESPSVGWKRKINLYDSKGRSISIRPSSFGITIHDGPTQHFFHCPSDTFYQLADLLRGG